MKNNIREIILFCLGIALYGISFLLPGTRDMQGYDYFQIVFMRLFNFQARNELSDDLFIIFLNMSNVAVWLLCIYFFKKPSRSALLFSVIGVCSAGTWLVMYLLNPDPDSDQTQCPAYYCWLMGQIFIALAYGIKFLKGVKEKEIAASEK